MAWHDANHITHWILVHPGWLGSASLLVSPIEDLGCYSQISRLGIESAPWNGAWASVWALKWVLGIRPGPWNGAAFIRVWLVLKISSEPDIKNVFPWNCCGALLLPLQAEKQVGCARLLLELHVCWWTLKGHSSTQAVWSQRGVETTVQFIMIT